MTAVSLCRRSSSSAKSNARCFRSLASSRWNYSFKYGTSPAWKRHTIPTMRRVNYGKTSRPSDMTSYHRNDKMFTSFVRSQLYPPGRKRMKHFKRRHTANETGIIATNARQTHVLLRTCRQSRLALMEQYDLTSTWNTFVNFDTDIFFFDVRWTGFLLSQHVCTRPVPQHLMLQYPEVMAQIKNLAIVNEFLGTLLSMGTFTGVDFNTFLEYDRSVKPLLKSVEKIFIIGHTIHCDNVLSVEETGCESWELGELRYMEEPIRCIRFATRRFCLAKQRTGISCRQCWTNMERETGSSLCGLLRGSLFA